MLIVALLFAVSINYDKIALLNSDPFFGMALTVVIIGVSFVLISAYSRISVPEKILLRKPLNRKILSPFQD